MAYILKRSKSILFLLLLSTNFIIPNPSTALESAENTIKNINITDADINDLKILEEKISLVRPKYIFIEQRLIVDSKDKKIAKKIHKISKKNKSKLYLVTGSNSWYTSIGTKNTIADINTFHKNIDGLVLRMSPDKTNIWQKEVEEFKIKILNQMLDNYVKIAKAAKKKNLTFIPEFPFWFSDFKGPKNNFSEDVCQITDKVIFLINDKNKLEEFEIEWNEISCKYLIDVTKRATELTPESSNEAIKFINQNLTLKENFEGYIQDLN